MTTTKTTKTYAYAVVPTQGMYGSGDSVRVAHRTDSLEVARKKAASLTRGYQAGMQPHGGSSGGYRVIEWGQDARTISGYSLDRTPDAR